MRRVCRRVNVVQILQSGVVIRVEFDDDAIGKRAVSRRVPAGGRECNFSVVCNFRGFDDCGLNTRDKAIAHIHCGMRKVHIVVARFLRINVFAQIRIGLIRRAIADGVCLREHSVCRSRSRSSGEKIYLKRASGGVFRIRLFGKCARNGFGGAGSGEAAETDIFAVPDKGGCFFRSESIEFHWNFQKKEFFAVFCRVPQR